MLLVELVSAAVSYGIFTLTTQELIPREDRSAAMLRVSASQGASLDSTRAQMQQVAKKLQPLLDSGEMKNVFPTSGQGGYKNSYFMAQTLAK